MQGIVLRGADWVNGGFGRNPGFAADHGFW